MLLATESTKKGPESDLEAAGPEEADRHDFTRSLLGTCKGTVRES